jgi:hypothetical protein
MSGRDSFIHAHDSVLFAAVSEPNLSLRPLLTPVFRLYYTGYREGGLIITLTPTEITVKRFDSLNQKYLTDTSRLDSLERWQITFFDKYFGTDRPNDTAIRKQHRHHYIDSIEKKYPQLNDLSYYWQLIRKELVSDTGAFPYTMVKSPITTGEYHSFVNRLNASGYWQMPYKRECNEAIADGPAYLALEANTPEKYNFVSGYVCPNDTIDFYKACQELVRYAKLDKEFGLLWIDHPQPDTSTRKPIVIQDVQLEEVKEPKKEKHKRIKTPHPN